MFKVFSLFFMALGIYIGMNYGDDVQRVMDSEAFDKAQTFLLESKEVFIDKIKDVIES